jgi:hypothetical protein
MAFKNRIIQKLASTVCVALPNIEGIKHPIVLTQVSKISTTTFSSSISTSVEA